MTDVLRSEQTSGIIIDPIQGKKPTHVLPFNPHSVIMETERVQAGTVKEVKPYSPSNAAMTGMAVDGALHNALSGAERQILGRYGAHLEEKYGVDVAHQFFDDAALAAQQVKEKLEPVLLGRDAFYIKGVPLGSPQRFQNQIYDAMRDPRLHQLTSDLGFESLKAMGLAAQTNPHSFTFQNGTEHTEDLRQLHANPRPPTLLPPEAVDFVLNASLMGHHVHPILDADGRVIDYKDYLKRNIAVPDVLAILLDPHHPKYAALRKAAEIFTQGIRGTDYFGYKFLGDISSLDPETLTAGALLADNAIVHRGKNMTWMPPVSFLLAEGKTLAHPTFTATNLIDEETLSDEILITKFSSDFGKTINAFRESFFNIYDAGRNAPESTEAYRHRRQEFEDGIFSFQNDYALALTSMVSVDGKGNFLTTRDRPVSRVVYVPGERAKNLADLDRAKVT